MRINRSLITIIIKCRLFAITMYPTMKKLPKHASDNIVNKTPNPMCVLLLSIMKITIDRKSKNYLL